MGVVAYGGKKLVPAPFVDISKEFHTTDDGQPVGSVYNIVLKGKFVVHKGSPNSAGTFWTASGYPPDEVLTADQCLGSLLRKQEALRTLFSVEGQTFEIQGDDGSAPLKCNPRVKRCDVSNGPWHTVLEYSVTLEADSIEGLAEAADPADYHISKASEEWNIEQADEKGTTFRLTHSISVTGKRHYDATGALVAPAWQTALDYATAVIGLGLNPDRMTAPGVLDEDALQPYNYVRSQRISERSGSVVLEEHWLCFDPQGQPPAVEEFTINARSSEDNRTTVSIEGTVTGLEVRDNNTRELISTKYANAIAKFTDHILLSLFSRCETVTGVTLNPFPVSKQQGHNQTTGVVTYSYEFNDRPQANVLGAVTETITVNDHNPTDVFASIPVLGRALGPVLQNIGTVTARKRSVSIEVVMPAATMIDAPIKPSTNALVLAFRPAGSTVFVDQDDESWNVYSGRYSRNVSFTWES